MFVSELRETLTELLRTRVRNGSDDGESSRKAYRDVATSLHNVLKGTRTLRTEMIDHCLYQLRLSVLDLVQPDTLAAYLRP